MMFNLMRELLTLRAGGTNCRDVVEAVFPLKSSLSRNQVRFKWLTVGVSIQSVTLTITVKTI